jgi:hypothetical protein
MAELLQSHGPTLHGSGMRRAGAVPEGQGSSRSCRSRAWPRPRHHGWLLAHPDSLHAGQQLKRRRVLVRRPRPDHLFWVAGTLVCLGRWLHRIPI